MTKETQELELIALRDENKRLLGEFRHLLRANESLVETILILRMALKEINRTAHQALSEVTKGSEPPEDEL